MEARVVVNTNKNRSHKGKAADEKILEFPAGVIAKAKGLITGITMDTDGNPKSDALVNTLFTAPEALHTGHVLKEVIFYKMEGPITCSVEDL